MDTPEPKFRDKSSATVVVEVSSVDGGGSTTGGWPVEIELCKKTIARTIARSANNQPARLPELALDLLRGTTYWPERCVSLTTRY